MMEGVSFSATTDNRRGIRLDPRTKLILLLTVTTLMFSTSNEGIMNFIKPVLSLIPFVLILSERRFKTAGKYLFLYLACFVLERIALTTLSGLLSFVVLAITSIMTRFAPGIMTGAYLLSSTSVSEFIGSMERMHLTEKIIIPMSVIFRFFPTISEEYQAIRDAMKMRGIRFGGKNPFLMVEYLVCWIKIIKRSPGAIWLISRLPLFRLLPPDVLAENYSVVNMKLLPKKLNHCVLMC